MTISERVDKWPYHLSVLTQEEIRWATEDENWQAFRMSLKGLDTRVKLAKLLSRYETWMRTEVDPRLRRRCQIQVDNYLNALKRGGQINGNCEYVR